MSWLRSTSRQRAFVRRPRDLVIAAVALASLVPMSLAVDGNEISDLEETLFHAINDLPDFLYWPLWPFMQLGNLIVIPIAALAVALLRWFRAAGAILALGALKLWIEDVIKSWVFRERPASVVSEVVLRGDSSSAGQAFVSGHAILAAGVATILHSYLGRKGRIVAWALVFLVCFGRVYAGAHFPLDVIGGAAVGVALGCILNFIVGVPSEMSDERVEA